MARPRRAPATLTALDELFVHQLPEPLPNVVTPHPHWRESYFFVLHPRDTIDGDVPILALAHFPARQIMDSLVMGRAGGRQLFRRYERPYDGDPHTTTVGPAHVKVDDPYEQLTVSVDDGEAGVIFDLTFTARSQAYGLRRGRMLDPADGYLIWDQSHMIQSGTYNGRLVIDGNEIVVQDWWGQRDHSWGIRDHARCFLWMWLALQFDDGMLGVWHWEMANGARIYTDGCWAPADGSDPIPVVDFHHDLTWTDADGKPMSYDMAAVRGLRGTCTVALADGQRLVVESKGAWAAPYGGLGGGQHLCEVTLDDGRTGNGIYEVTGSNHHKYFPRAE